jgi:ABC-2 type transport system ATP-binding protein
MRQRVKVAQALVHQPLVIVLDEPLTGLDPRQRLHMISLFHRLGDEGRCVIISSHVLDEVERFGSRVLVIAQGRLAAEGDFHAIRNLMDDRPLRIRVRTDQPRALASRLIAGPGAIGVRAGRDGSLLVDTIDVAAFRTTIARDARDVRARLFEVTTLDDDLESVFRYLVDPAARAGGRQ